MTWEISIKGLQNVNIFFNLRGMHALIHALKGLWLAKHYIWINWCWRFRKCNGRMDSSRKVICADASYNYYYFEWSFCLESGPITNLKPTCVDKTGYSSEGAIYLSTAGLHKFKWWKKEHSAVNIGFISIIKLYSVLSIRNAVALWLVIDKVNGIFMEIYVKSWWGIWCKPLNVLHTFQGEHRLMEDWVILWNNYLIVLIFYFQKRN